ncbi:hypothetical protein Sste5346_001828 [Sporothrix stenoceras]|uniref:Uncharacterized protein n=1 Tax=Sporothrix stenoceras TaxID=5173 RepID=A0ABR3ZNK1_9PEZI
MAWDSKAALASRRRTNSSASRTSASSILTLQQKNGTPVQPKSAHVADPFLQDFLQPGFDPATYWNTVLGGGGSISAGTGASRTRSPAPSSSGAAGRLAAAASSATATADRAAQAQATLSQLGAHTSRLTTVLIQLTDDILRSGRRLAYEVQLLRGETLGLGEVVEKHLALLDETDSGIAPAEEAKGVAANKEEGEEGTESGAAAAAAAATAGDPTASSSEPPSLAQLRMLAQVRSRLDAVIRTFGEAMEFIMPPSAISVTSSFLSVSGPDQESGGSAARRAGGGQDAATTTSMEDKGQNILRGLRDEITRLLEGANVNDGAEAAAARVEALRTLCRVWAGTAEEKARLKFIESLQRMVEDKQKELDCERERLERLQKEKLERESSQGNASGSSGGASSAGQGQLDGSAASGTGASRGYAAAGLGFISQLQKIRSGL